MNKKRFYYVPYDAETNSWGVDEDLPNKSYAIRRVKEKVVEVMNSLNEENKDLKLENLQLVIDNKELKCTNNELYNENEELKYHLNRIEKDLQEYKDEHIGWKSLPVK